MSVARLPQALSADARPAPPGEWRQARRLLCIRLDNLGDLLMTTPALRALKSAAPGRHLTLLGSAAGVSAAPYLAELDAALSYDAPWVKSEAASAPENDRAMIEILRAHGFDAAVIFTVHTQSALPAALLCRLAGIPRVLAHARENPYRLLSDWLPEIEPQVARHEVRRQLDLVAAVDATTADERLAFRVGAEDRARLEVKLRQLGIDPAQPWVLMHPGATAPSRRYPPESYATAAELIARRLRCPVLFGGDCGERALVDMVRARMQVPAPSLAGALSLGECAAAIESATVLVANNSGPVHLAAALGTPVVDLYALTNPQHTPWQVPSRVLFHDVPCRWCLRSVCPEGHHDCLRRVPPEDVAQACEELFTQALAQERRNPEPLRNAFGVTR